MKPDFRCSRKLLPLWDRKRYKAAYGGRGSGKSVNFANMMISRAYEQPGFRGLCVREVQKSLEQSAKALLKKTIEERGLSSVFDVQRDRIITPGDGLIVFSGMSDHTAETIKSYEGFDVAWIEEAQTLSQISLTLLRPTIRKEGSEIWAGWNPRRKQDPVEVFFRTDPPADSIVVNVNYDDNPWFPAVLDAERLEDKQKRPEEYPHVWEGDYIQIASGAYFAKALLEAKATKRIGNVAADPLMRFQAFWDIGGTGARADATSIWVVQFVGREIRVLDYYEAQGQPLATHLNWLRNNGYENALCVLPHDGATNDKVYSVSFESAIREAGFAVSVVPNQGKGAAAQRIEAVRRLFPSIWFNAATTEAGREALGWYHERIDEKRQIGLGPEHDWSSHAADAFGLMAMAYEAPREKKKPKRRERNREWSMS